MLVDTKIYLKLDSVTILLPVANLREAFQVLFKCFWIFQVQYPTHVRFVYSLFEKLTNLTLKNDLSAKKLNSVKSKAVTDLIKKLK